MARTRALFRKEEEEAGPGKKTAMPLHNEEEDDEDTIVVAKRKPFSPPSINNSIPVKHQKLDLGSDRVDSGGDDEDDDDSVGGKDDLKFDPDSDDEENMPFDQKDIKAEEGNDNELGDEYEAEIGEQKEHDEEKRQDLIAKIRAVRKRYAELTEQYELAGEELRRVRHQNSLVAELGKRMNKKMAKCKAMVADAGIELGGDSGILAVLKVIKPFIDELKAIEAADAVEAAAADAGEAGDVVVAED